LKLPHCKPPQVTVQVTPAFAESPVTDAMTLAVAPVANEEGGGVLSVTVIAGAVVTVMEAVADFVVSETEVAVSVSTPVPGTVAGAVKLVLAPLPVFVGLKLPQDEVLQETDQVTPPLSASLLTVAEMVVEVPTCIVDTRCELSVTEIAAGGLGLLPDTVQPTAIKTTNVPARKLKNKRRRFTEHLR
jgi:hypothetical protein